jgi:UDPglucose--hexose-1-phosphate uridylyltransferase
MSFSKQTLSIKDHPHRRLNPLTGEWVLVSPQRAKRPWQGQMETAENNLRPDYDANCYLCPGNTRISGDENANYEDTFVFQNDFAALQNDHFSAPANNDPLLQAIPARGLSRVICYSPDHAKTLPELKTSDIAKVIHCWQEQAQELGNDFLWVQIFENKGAVMGCSQPHPHGQIWANDFLPTEMQKKEQHLKSYYQENERNLLLDYVEREIMLDERIVYANEHWVALVPYWAAWPFETLLLPKVALKRFDDIDEMLRDTLADALKILTTLYDNLFQCSFPYSMGWHFAPYYKDQRSVEHWQMHASFYPPLLRSASIRKFMVGYEMMAEPQRDLTPEQAAAMLKQQPRKHYLEN